MIAHERHFTVVLRWITLNIPVFFMLVHVFIVCEVLSIGWSCKVIHHNSATIHLTLCTATTIVSHSVLSVTTFHIV